MDFEQQLKEIILSNEWLMEILKAVRKCDPPHWYVGAGIIRNIVWDRLHGYKIPTPTRDVDVAIFDKTDLNSKKDRLIQEQLKLLLPEIEWEVTNQAGVHLWYEKHFGFQVEPYVSCEDAISTWPETATSIGVRLLEDESIKIFAPYGLEDLFTMTLRRNTKRITKEIFLHRVLEKQICKKWPEVTVVHE